VEKLFYPESIMVVGVSDTPTNLGRHIVGNLDRFHFRGPLYLVGREGGSLNGRKIYARIEEIDASVDLAVFLIPAPFIPEALEVCGEKGIRYAVIESGGFSEFTEDDRRLDERVVEIAKEWHIRFVGPNCISIINLENGMVLPFVPMHPERIKNGPVSFIAQSGGVINYSLRLCSGENLGFNKLISMGNKLNLNECDYLEYLISDPGTKTIGLYLESILQGRRLMDLAVSTRKPIVVLKSNTDTASNQIARFHTAALAGDDEVVSSALDQAGIHRVHTLQEMMNAFKIFNLPPMKGPNLAVISRSGGSAVMAADSAAKFGFQMTPFSEDFIQFVGKRVRAGVIRMTNPLDLGDVFDLRFYQEIIERALHKDSVDGLLFSHGYFPGIDDEATKKLIHSAYDLSMRYRKPVVFCVIADSEEWFSLRKMTDFPLFTEPEDALKALRISLCHHRNGADRDLHSNRKFELPTENAPSMQGQAHRIMEPREVFELLLDHGIPVAEYRVVSNYEEALEGASDIGYPVALKTADPDEVHKTEVGGVRLNIGNPDELKDALQGITGGCFLVQKMADAGHEVFIGGKHDQEFGPAILFGMGGIFVEVLNDVVIKVAPITEREAGEMIETVKGSVLLKGFRGGAKADVDALRECLVRVSRLLYEHEEIQQLDINPLVVGREGLGCQVVDAKIFS
jgi:acyl-CoA synthetase (NDP forming)